MIIRRILPEEKDEYEELAAHPLQSWAWGEFKKANGAKVERLGVFQAGQLRKVWQVFFHPLPHLSWQIGYFPRAAELNARQLAAIADLAKSHRALSVLIEPNIIQFRWPNKRGHLAARRDVGKPVEPLALGLQPANRPLFARHTFILNLAPSEEELLANMHPKTRYNIRLAERKGVEVREDNSPAALKIFLDLLFQTTRRQRFYLHNRQYFRQMWAVLRPAGLAHIFLAFHKGEPLAAWIVFGYKNRLYYPYGASAGAHRELMASNLLCWRIIQYGRRHGYRQFDLWGSLGPDANPDDPWYGFHRFKQGYGPDLVQFIGSWDLVLQSLGYRTYNLLNGLRWRWLHLRRKI